MKSFFFFLFNPHDAAERRARSSAASCAAKCSLLCDNFCMTYNRKTVTKRHGRAACVGRKKRAKRRRRRRKKTKHTHKHTRGREREEETCTERPTSLNQRERKMFKKKKKKNGLLSSFLLAPQSDFKPSGSPAVHFWVLQASKHWAPTRFFNPFSGFSVKTRATLFCRGCEIKRGEIVFNMFFSPLQADCNVWTYYYIYLMHASSGTCRGRGGCWGPWAPATPPWPKSPLLCSAFF